MYRKSRPIKTRKEKCPFCDPKFVPRDPFRESQCVLNKPLWMVIPPGGVHLSCPVHPEGHHVFGPGVTWMGDRAEKYPRPNLPEPDDNLPDPGFKVTGKPWCGHKDCPHIVRIGGNPHYGDIQR